MVPDNGEERGNNGVLRNSDMWRRFLMEVLMGSRGVNDEKLENRCGVLEKEGI